MDWIALISRVAHILAATALVGGMIYLRAVLTPSLGVLDGERSNHFTEAIRRRWAKVVMISALFLIVSGFYNYVAIIQLGKTGGAPLPSYYHPMIGSKMMLALFIFYVASMLAGRTAAAERFRRHAPLWMNLNLAAAIAVVVIGGALRTGAQPIQPAAQPDPSTSSLDNVDSEG